MKSLFGKNGNKAVSSEWDWEGFKSTKDFPISKHLLSWVVGQDHALKECSLCLDEWAHKLKVLEKRRWWEFWKKKEEDKGIRIEEQLSPGPYLFLLGDPGTGKSLMGKALAEKLTLLYKDKKIKLYDVLCWKNKVVPGEPKITVHSAGVARKVLFGEKVKESRKGMLVNAGWRIGQAIMLFFGTTLLGISIYYLFSALMAGVPFMDAVLMVAPIAAAGGSLFFLGAFLNWIRRLLSGGAGLSGIAGSKSSGTPKLLVDNAKRKAPFIDATGHKSSQLFGDIAWDPYQTGGLGTPEHQRVTAGDVHRASMGILYIDEIKNLHPQEATTLLTVLEEGQLPITCRSTYHGSGTAAMSVSTEPVPALTFLVAAGNFDSINAIHPALMDRIYGYGKVVRMENDMPNTVENRRKYIQFISQEVSRFSLLPFSREACIEIVDEGRRRSNKRDALTTKFRPLISIIKTSATLAMNEGCEVVEAKHVLEAINEHCLTIQKQILEHYVKEKGKLLEIEPKGHMLGSIYGLSVISDKYSGEKTGMVSRVNAQMVKKSERQKKLKGYYNVTGISKEAEYMPGSIAKVRAVILQKYGIDIAQEYFTHIDFSQSYRVDGPSAGVTMALLLCSLIEGKPLRQDIAVTGEINISSTDQIDITAVGGLYEKIKAAERWGFKKVVIPHKNYKHSIDPKDYKLEVLSGKTLDDYLKVMLVSE